MESVLTFPVREDGEGVGTVALTTAATTPFRAAEKAWRAESERTRAARPVAGGGITGCPRPTGGTQPPDGKPYVGGSGVGVGLGG